MPGEGKGVWGLGVRKVIGRKTEYLLQYLLELQKSDNSTYSFFSNNFHIIDLLDYSGDLPGVWIR
jgi:hypothetical protein